MSTSKELPRTVKPVPNSLRKKRSAQNRVPSGLVVYLSVMSFFSLRYRGVRYTPGDK